MRAAAAIFAVAALILLALPAPAQSSDAYVLTQVDVPGRIVRFSRAPDGLFALTADGRAHLVFDRQGSVDFHTVAGFDSSPDRPTDRIPDSLDLLASGHIRSVRLTDPTRRYRHGVLGDRLEAASLTVLMEGGDVVVLEAGEDGVFEDLVPRLADLDGDGRDEIVIVKSYLDRGAALAVIGLDAKDRLAVLAETPPIGRPNRWLNPIGAADFDGDGAVEIAYVETPHIGGTLMIWEWRDGTLVQEHAEPGFSNHAIGSTELGLSAIVDFDGDGLMDLAVPTSRRDRLRLISLSRGVLREIADIELGGVVSTAIAPVGDALVFGLDDGRLIALRFAP